MSAAASRLRNPPSFLVRRRDLSQAPLDRVPKLRGAFPANHRADKSFDHLAIFAEHVGGGQRSVGKISQEGEVAPTDVLSEIGWLPCESSFNFFAVVELVAVVHGNQQNLFVEVGGHLHQLRDLLDTGSAPIRPEVEEDHAPAKIGDG